MGATIERKNAKIDRGNANIKRGNAKITRQNATIRSLNETIAAKDKLLQAKAIAPKDQQLRECVKLINDTSFWTASGARKWFEAHDLTSVLAEVKGASDGSLELK